MMHDKPNELAVYDGPSGPAAHPALTKTWWLNLYPTGECSGTLCDTRENALNRCTYTGDTPDAAQVEVRMVLVPPNDPSSATCRRQLLNYEEETKPRQTPSGR